MENEAQLRRRICTECLQWSKAVKGSGATSPHLYRPRLRQTLRWRWSPIRGIFPRTADVAIVAWPSRSLRSLVEETRKILPSSCNHRLLGNDPRPMRPIWPTQLPRDRHNDSRRCKSADTAVGRPQLSPSQGNAARNLPSVQVNVLQLRQLGHYVPCKCAERNPSKATWGTDGKPATMIAIKICFRTFPKFLPKSKMANLGS